MWINYPAVIIVSLILYWMHMHGCVVQVGDIWLRCMSEYADLRPFVSC